MKKFLKIRAFNSFNVEQSQFVYVEHCNKVIGLPDESTKVITYEKGTGIHTEEKFSELFLTTSESCALTYSFTKVDTNYAVTPFTGTDIAFNTETEFISVDS